MNARISFLAAACFAVGSGCSDDTGILVEVHGEELQVAVHKLDTMVILDDGSATRPDQQQWGTADNRQDTVAGNLDLRVEPYKVMLRPDGVATDATLWVAAIAYDEGGTVIGFGELPGMIGFAPDLVLRVQLDLDPATKLDPGDGGGCVVSNGVVVVRTSDDCDGDHSPFTEDCDDLDAEVIADLDEDPAVCQDDCDPTNGDIYPENDEVCDGLDNDCDESTSAPPELCAIVTTEAGGGIATCRIGQRDCLDVDPDAPYDICRGVTLDTTTNSEVCTGWVDCDDGADPSCLVDAQVHCKLPVATGPGGVCVQAVGNLHDLVSGATDCTWRLIGNVQNGSWNIGLRPISGDALVTFVDGCEAELVVAGGPTSGVVPPKLVVLEVNLDGTRSVVSVLLDPTRDACTPGDGSELTCSVVGGAL